MRLRVTIRVVCACFGVLGAVAGITLFLRQGPRRDVSQTVLSEAVPRTPPARSAASNSQTSPSQPARVASAPDWRTFDDPSRDGWDTEAFSERSHQQLDQLAALVVHPEQIDVEHVRSLVADDFSCAPLLPPLSDVYQDKVVRLRRGAADLTEPGTCRGAQGLVEQLKSLAAPFAGADDLRFKFKVFNVEDHGKSIVTRQYFSLSGRTAQQVVEQHSTWTVRWEAADAELPRLTWIGVSDFEQAISRHPRGPMFVDCTESVISGNASYAEQFLHGFNHWLERLQDTDYFAMLGTPGLVVGDVNSDGLDDLYICQEGGLPNRLFVQQADGTARDVSRTAAVDWLERTRSALLVDLDNDGDQDIVAATIGNIVLAANDGAGRFDVRAAVACDHDTMSLSAADYDNDGDLDLYVCVYGAVEQPLDESSESGPALTARIVYHDANNAGRNSLFRNEISGDTWSFSDVTPEVGLDMNNRRYSFAAAWEDYDNDGDQDLYVANDFGRNNLYRNELSADGQARFVDVAAAAEAEDSASGMSVTWADVDRDGRMDLYISNMFSAAGSRVTRQARFQPAAPGGVRERLQRFARGNTLLQNLGDGTFRDTSVAAGVTLGGWAWSSNFVDINNDGWDDLVVANGFITGEDSGDL